MLALTGIGASIANSSSIGVTYENIEIVSVRDPGALPLVSGNSYLFRGIKVKSYKITIKDANEAQLAAQLTYKGGTYKISTGPGSAQAEVNIVGDGLYVAYQTLSVQKTSGTSQNFHLRDAKGRGQTYSIGDRYELNIEQDAVMKCVLDALNKRGHQVTAKALFFPFLDRYKGWWQTGGDDKHSWAWLTFPECDHLSYEITVNNTDSGSDSLPTKISLPFERNAAEKRDYVVGRYFKGNGYVVDKLFFFRVANRDNEWKAPDGRTSEGITLEGQVRLLREEFRLAIND
ncbi:MAG: hypothetical protein KF892_10080 [Rhizobacter sp.]|nr:hypothetical protein [Rhizobacter sp.]